MIILGGRNKKRATKLEFKTVFLVVEGYLVFVFRHHRNVYCFLKSIIIFGKLLHLKTEASYVFSFKGNMTCLSRCNLLHGSALHQFLK